MALSKPCISPLRLALIASILVYLFVPSHLISHLSSQPGIATVSDAGRKVIKSIQSTVSSPLSARRLPSGAFARGECQTKSKGVCIVAACMNRHETLRKVLPTWLAVRNVHQVVIVDWSSEPPLQGVLSASPKYNSDARIKLVRVNNESSWVLSRAYNLAVQQSSCPYILRTDCDYALHQDILSVHDVKATANSFYTGNWREARNNNEAHLNGAMVVKRNLFLSVGGYDERIQTYGWDDEDLYTRLEAKHLTRLNVSYDHVAHTPHDDASRAQSGVKFAQVQIDVNRILLEKLAPWSESIMRSAGSSEYRLLRDDAGNAENQSSSNESTAAGINDNEGGADGRYVEVRAERVPEALQKRFSRDEVDRAWSLALGRRLADDHAMPWDVMTSMSPGVRESLLRKLMRVQDELDELAANGTRTMLVRGGKVVAAPTVARVMIVHCQHGLGNRLRALASALAFAKNARRVGIVIWERDAHIAAEFEELFELGTMAQAEKELIIVPKLTAKWPFSGSAEVEWAWREFRLYNYMEMEGGAVKRETIVNDVDAHLYYKGAYVMEAWDYTGWEAANEELRKLRPVAWVRRQLQALQARGLRQAIGVHVRNRTLERDIDAVDARAEYGEAAVREMGRWRRASGVQTFVAEMQRLVRDEAGEADARFYVASDTWQVVQLLQRRFPARLIVDAQRVACDDRLVACVRWAVVDLWALGQTRRLLGSNWSSYTEAAQRLSGLRARLSGVDFGAKVAVGRDAAGAPPTDAPSVNGERLD